MTIKECATNARGKLTPLYGQREANALVQTIFYHLKGYKPIDLALKGDNDVSEFIAHKVENVVMRLLKSEPIQYIFNSAYFYGMDLTVTPDTLIPRPETAEMVDMIVSKLGETPDLRVLDIGTGSGCIAIALARNLKFATVDATDISEKALHIAHENATRLKASVNFQKSNILNAIPPPSVYDIIVSNPPYITDSEKEEMKANVVDYEPHNALFVPDSDPLRYYSAISTYALGGLKSGGHLYLEINPLFSSRLVSKMEDDEWQEVTLVRDTHGKNRFVTALKP